MFVKKVLEHDCENDLHFHRLSIEGEGSLTEKSVDEVRIIQTESALCEGETLDLLEPCELAKLHVELIAERLLLKSGHVLLANVRSDFFNHLQDVHADVLGVGGF